MGPSSMSVCLSLASFSRSCLNELQFRPYSNSRMDERIFMKCSMKIIFLEPPKLQFSSLVNFKHGYKIKTNCLIITVWPFLTYDVVGYMGLLTPCFQYFECILRLHFQGGQATQKIREGRHAPVPEDFQYIVGYIILRL